MMQLASAFASLINGGYYYQPHIVKKILDDNGNTVQNIEPLLLKQTVSKQTSDKLRGYLYRTVSEGTGKSAKVEGYSMGGKTGTAEKGDRTEDRYIVSFIGFAPADNPQVLLYIVIDEANVAKEKQSSALATAIAKEIFTELLPYLNIFPDETAPDSEPTEGSGGEENTPEAGEGTENSSGTEAGESGTGEGENPSNPDGTWGAGDGENPSEPEGEGASPVTGGPEYPAEGVPNMLP